ncbi:hypothetical protein IQ243_17140 [Nostocales cyanobacterium LEGE 11386]|nr:hypothetical protein [Nostocales cyanobacterium LEGE 11386]
MQSKEIKTENTSDYMKCKNSREPEPMTQVQKNRVITSQDLPDKRLRYGLTLVVLTALLFTAAIYYGIINP